MTVRATVIKPNLKCFGQFPEVEVVNPDEQIFDKHYLVCIDHFSVYYVISCSEQDALDELVDYCEGRYPGYFLDPDDEDIDEDTLFAGNHGLPIAADTLIIEQI